MHCVASAVIHVEIGSDESSHSHCQKPESPSDKRMSPMQHFSSSLGQTRDSQEDGSLKCIYICRSNKYGKLIDFLYSIFQFEKTTLNLPGRVLPPERIFQKNKSVS